MPWNFWKAKQKPAQGGTATFTRLARASSGANQLAGTSAEAWQQVEHLHIGSEQQLQHNDQSWSTAHCDHPANDVIGSVNNVISSVSSTQQPASTTLLRGCAGSLPSTLQRQAHGHLRYTSMPEVQSRITELEEQVHSELTSAAKQRAIMEQVPLNWPASQEATAVQAPAVRQTSRPMPASPLLSMPLQPLLEGTEGPDSQSSASGSSMGVACSTASEDSCIPPTMVRSVPTDGSAPAEVLRLARPARSEGDSPRGLAEFDFGFRSPSEKPLRDEHILASPESEPDPQQVGQSKACAAYGLAGRVTMHVYAPRLNINMLGKNEAFTSNACNT